MENMEFAKNFRSIENIEFFQKIKYSLNIKLFFGIMSLDHNKNDLCWSVCLNIWFWKNEIFSKNSKIDVTRKNKEMRWFKKIWNNNKKTRDQTELLKASDEDIGSNKGLK